jgi:23S rRNA (cytidine2498-2'-O)-methyltransferase
MPTQGQYLFAICQVGAENALKSELKREWPQLHLSYSRRGLVTFKWVGEGILADDLDLRSTFARCHGFSLGRVNGTEAAAMAREVWRIAEGRDYSHVHVWQRDPCPPGQHGFEPGVSELAEEVSRHVIAARPERGLPQRPLLANVRARPGDYVLDCVLVEPNEWIAGYHRVTSVPARYPGGVCLSARREVVPISRAYWKMREALTWSQLPLVRGDRCVEIGSAPGGAAQALLAAGLRVTGIDPAEMDESVLRHPRFTHVRKRAADVKRREFRGVRWLMADSNVVPGQTLKSIEDIVTHREVHIRGLLLTLKLSEWKLADQIGDFVARVRRWGYHYVRTRQLAFNRQEICLVALRERSQRRASRVKKQPDIS